MKSRFVAIAAVLVLGVSMAGPMVASADGGNALHPSHNHGHRQVNPKVEVFVAVHPVHQQQHKHR